MTSQPQFLLSVQRSHKERNQAKDLGAKWDREAQSWFVPTNTDLNLFSQWPRIDAVVSLYRQYLAVPYDERTTAKAAGALWDKQVKSWYVGEDGNWEILKQWLPENLKHQQAPAMSPQQEFTEALISLGCLVTDEHPNMDGQTHRIATEGDKPGERAGFYVAYLDGHPAGYIQNNRTGESLKWKAKGYSLSDAEKAQLQAQNAAKVQAREAARQAKQNAVAQTIRQLVEVAPPAPANHPYLLSKQARPNGLYIVPDTLDNILLPELILIGRDKKESQKLRRDNPDKLVFTSGDLLLPAIDINGDIQSIQTIQPNGTKRFVKDGAKQELFHIVGNRRLDDLAKAPVIVIGEGYATADTLSQALGQPTVAAFDSGNLPHVAKQLRTKFPEKPIIIAGDNDLHLELTEGKNPGKEKALEAAKLFNGKAIFPIFAPDEQSYTANLILITSEKARKDALSDDQKAALAKMKGFTDFNDLATKSIFGMAGVERQVINLVNRIIAQNLEQIEFKLQQANEEKNVQQLAQRKAMRI